MDRPESDLNALEARLSAWSPSAPGLDRDRMMFLAGRAAARSESRGRLAVASAGLLAILAVGLGGMLAREHGRVRSLEVRLAEVQRVPTPASVPSPRPEPGPPPLPDVAPPQPGSYLVLTHRALNPETSDRPAPADPPASSPGRDSPEILRVRDRAAWTEL